MLIYIILYVFLFSMKIMEPNIPQLSSKSAVSAALSPIKLMITKAVTATTNFVSNVAESFSPTVIQTAQTFSINAVTMASTIFTTSLVFLLNSGGSAYNTINSKLIEFVEADIETESNSKNNFVSNEGDVSSGASLSSTLNVNPPDDEVVIDS
jgi:hypothetical protein